ncbi:MAG: branched-chain amino acid ABC transporter permease [Bosea sp. (in: a-proteobacteria)]|uniref:branched-chain amino acid ABC transporter permease n=1 Tax=unclassified Bosea (in: a-proteobacteria) TaxID=2653178 RepID=UPI000969031A|nr:MULTISPECIES: branched-chain amino acid ABC transporter permease [unclassified Bosea (in: a-proteobacteria)]MBN9457666.1 branched-chain amino acid ABC transporter permease [Bosea sp. (in: a-proteobacteria)]OJV10242.1 MAG: branched-chain amino acid ABC transporter permease [Bosea sp. 67-29]
MSSSPLASAPEGRPGLPGAALGGLALAALLAVALPFFTTGYVVYIANLLLVFVVLCLGLHIVIGETGQFSMAHAAFYGIGIYASALANRAVDLPYPFAMLFGALVAGAVGLFIGALALRMRDIYLALATFAFGEAMQWVFANWDSVTNGPNGLRIAPARFGPLEILSDKQAYPFVLFFCLLAIGFTVVVSRSRLGRAFRAVRESEVAAMAMGIDVRRTRVIGFGLSAAVAGFAGGMFGLFQTFIHPDSLGFQTTILVLTMVVVGGLGSIWGAIGGAIVFGLISEVLRQAPQYQEIIYGAILMLFMMYAPHGLFAFVGERIREARHGR